MRSLGGISSEAEYASDNLAATKYVFIVDEGLDARRSMFAFLSERGFMPSSYRSAQDFLDNIGHLQPGCLLIGDLGGELDTLGLIGALGPRIDEFPVVVTVSHCAVGTAVQAMKLGASDVLELPFGRDVLPAMLGSLLRDLEQRSTKARSSRRARDLVQALSAREREVLRSLLRGFCNKDIARHLNISLRTVEMHRANMLARLQVTNIVDALRLAFEADFPASSED